MSILDRLRRRAPVTYEAHARACMERLTRHLRENDRAWGLGSAQHWDLDIEGGTLSFTLADGRTAVTPVQVAGTYSPAHGEFVWAWANPSLPVLLTAHARAAKHFGEEHALGTLVAESFRCDEHGAWEATAVVLKAGGAAGAYRAPIGEVMVFLTFGPPSFRTALAA